ncbi:MAG: FTR1 family iron permease, partial [Anaerolineales bacterium]
MISSFLLSLRESLEAALIIGIILGVLQKVAKGEFKLAVWLGVFCAAMVSFLLAVGLQLFGFELEGMAEHIFEGSTMFLAGLVLTWMIFWMNAQSNRLRRGVEAEVKEAVSSSSAWALFGIVFVAVLREGVELALFLTAA